MDIRENIIMAVVAALQERVPDDVINTVQDVLIIKLNLPEGYIWQLLHPKYLQHV